MGQLYTKAYELFKKYGPVNSQNQNQGRLTLWIAFRIAQTYYDSGKFDMAVRCVICSEHLGAVDSIDGNLAQLLRAYSKDISAGEMGVHAQTAVDHLVYVCAATRGCGPQRKAVGGDAGTRQA